MPGEVNASVRGGRPSLPRSDIAVTREAKGAPTSIRSLTSTNSEILTITTVNLPFSDTCRLCLALSYLYYTASSSSSKLQSATMSFDSPLPAYNSTDPSASFLSTSCFDFLLIELVPMAYRLASELSPSLDQLAGYSDPSSTSKLKPRQSSVTGTNATIDEDEERDAAYFRLESLGYRVGQGIVERFVFPIFLCVSYHS